MSLRQEYWCAMQRTENCICMMFIFQVQNCDNQKTNGQDYHKFLICTHKPTPSARLRTNGCTPPGCPGKGMKVKSKSRR